MGRAQQNSGIGDLHLALVRPLKGSAVEAGNVAGKCPHDQQNVKIPQLRLLPGLEVFHAHSPHRGRMVAACTRLSKHLSVKYILT